MNPVLIKPLISEKSMRDAAKNRYTFLVHQDANKSQIMKEVAEVFKVKPMSVKTIMMKGKVSQNKKTRSLSRDQNRKKAIIELSVGQKLDIFDTTDAKKV